MASQLEFKASVAGAASGLRAPTRTRMCLLRFNGVLSGSGRPPADLSRSCL